MPGRDILIDPEIFGLNFLKPDNLKIAFLVIPVFILSVLHYVLKYRELKILSPLSNGNGRGNIKIRYLLGSLSFLLFIFTFSLTAAIPYHGTRQVEVRMSGFDIAFAFDISRSMEVPDVKSDAPDVEVENTQGAEIENTRGVSRLSRSIDSCENLIAFENQRQSGTRFSLSVGKGKGINTVPLTSDTVAIENTLAALEILSATGFTSRGTNLEKLVISAAGSFDESFERQKAVLLYTDGEELSGSLEKAVTQLGDNGIYVVIAGAGSQMESEFLEQCAGAPNCSFFDINDRREDRSIFNFLVEAAGKNGKWTFKEVPDTKKTEFLLLTIFFMLSAIAFRLKKL
jgi:hypothetical protein